jgi:putative ABC transport system permease protein
MMMAWAYVRIAMRVLRAHKLRSLLTVVSITIGAFAIVVMTSLADGGLQTIMTDIENMGGARLLLISPDEPERMKDKRQLSPGYFRPDDRRALDDALPHLAEKTWYLSLDESELSTEDGQVRMTDVLAADTGFLSAFGMQIGRGRLFSDEEHHTRQAVCVVGHAVAQELFAGDAVGKRITVLGTRCLIVGQTAKLTRMGMSFGFSWDGFVLLPLDTMQDIDRTAAAGVTLVAKTEAVTHNDIVKRIANAVLAHRHHGVDDYEIWDFAGIVGQFQGIFLILKIIVGMVAGISLLVGGVGVMNMMFVSITERTKEIGIRKALGASPRAIQAQFLFEATFLSVVGGVLGVSLGVLASMVMNIVIKHIEPVWVAAISIPAVTVSLLVSLTVGIGFGFVPAKRAAALDAVEAMRR